MNRLLFATLLLPLGSFAARTSQPATVDELSAQATDIVVAEVIAARTVELGHRVLTTYTLMPVRSLKGHDQPRFAITIPGGVIDEMEVQTGSVPVWREGETALLFLADDRLVSLDGALTVRDGQVFDGLERTVEAMPLTVNAVRERIAED